MRRREGIRKGRGGRADKRERKVIIEERGHSEKERGRVKGEEDKSRIRGGKWKIKGTRQYSYILFFSRQTRQKTKGGRDAQCKENETKQSNYEKKR